MSSAAPGRDVVPVVERLRLLQALRVVFVVLVAAGTAVVDGAHVAPAHVLVASGAFLVLTGGLQALWRVAPSAVPALAGGALMLDGLYLAGAAWAIGGAAWVGGPVSSLVLVHLIAVALLASYRTGMKLAAWHSLLLLVVFYAQEGGLLAGEPPPFGDIGAFTAVLWAVALVTATASAVNERELRRRRFDLEALATMGRRLEDAGSPAGVAEVLLATVADAFDGERAAVFATPGHEDDLVLLAARGEAADVALPRGLAAGRTRLVTAPDGPLGEALPGARRLVVVPLDGGGGVLLVAHGERRIERRVIGMLERCAAHAGLALRNAWLLEEIRQLATTDGLTRLANRATFDRTLAQELDRARRNDGQSALLLLDVDHFKRLNDTHGHQVGDDVLRAVAVVLRDACRSYDVAARYGGEEFAVVLPHTGAMDALVIGDRLRRAIATAPLPVPITVSVGVAAFPSDAADPAALVGAADRALYASKHGGRDRVTAAGAMPVA